MVAGNGRSYTVRHEEWAIDSPAAESDVLGVVAHIARKAEGHDTELWFKAHNNEIVIGFSYAVEESAYGGLLAASQKSVRDLIAENEALRRSLVELAPADPPAFEVGYATAVAHLRDDDRYRNWWSSKGGAPTREMRLHLADYLEQVNKPLHGPRLPHTHAPDGDGTDDCAACTVLDEAAAKRREDRA